MVMAPGFIVIFALLALDGKQMTPPSKWSMADAERGGNGSGMTGTCYSLC